MTTAAKRSPKHKVNVLAGRLRERISSGELAIGSPLPSPRELAKSNGISAITVNRIMSRLADEGLVNRIKGKGTFVGSPTAQQLTIGLNFYIPDAGSPLDQSTAFSVFQDSAGAAIHEAGHKVLNIPFFGLHDASSGRKWLAQIDALVISISCINHLVVELLRNFSKPCVIIQQCDPYPLPFNQVVPELSTGFTEAIICFRQLGLTRLAITGTSGGHSGRLGAIRTCAMMLGYADDAIEPVLADAIIGDMGRMRGYRIGRQLLEAGHLNETGIFSVSDFISFGIIDAFSEAGLKPGEDYHLISFDDLEADGLLPFDEPMLTSVSFPRREIARNAVNLVLSRIEKPSTNLVSLRIPTSLTQRRTCRVTLDNNKKEIKQCVFL
ncbi:MAG: LacI family DNA-binding transcriptional regulator [Victivallales bacterium]|nr:LacI family DNA-binding transcriptional regulator [Victivallales bacterium]